MTIPALATQLREVTADIREQLDRTERLAPGRGHLDLGAFVRGLSGGGLAGGALDYQHRVTPSKSIFSSAEIGYGWGTVGGLHYQATAGLRMRF